VSDFNAVDSTRFNSFRDSGFNARGRSPGSLVRPVDVSLSFAPIYDGCVGEVYPALKPSCTTPAPLTQTFELLIFEAPFFDTNVEWTSPDLPAGMALFDPDPTDNKINITGTPTVAGNQSFTLRAAGDNGDGAGTFTVRIRRAVQWANVADWLAVISPGYSSDGIMVLTGNYNWLVFGPNDQSMFWYGKVCKAASPQIDIRVGVDPAGGSDASFSADASTWTKTGTPTVAPGSYANGALVPTVATIVEL
jgi:hypothetical protein